MSWRENDPKARATAPYSTVAFMGARARLDRYPRLGVEDGQLGRWLDRTRQQGDSLLALLAEMYPTERGMDQ
jgi:hypothetical protein